MPLAALSVTEKLMATVPLSPSVTLAEPIETVGNASSSVIVPVPVPVKMVALVGLLNFTATVSFGSSKVSPFTVTAMLLVVSPAAKVKVPEVSASKSVPEVAVPVVASAYFTVTCLPLAALSVTEKLMATVPLSPSVTLAAPIEIVGAASLSVIVPMPVPVEIVALVGLLSFTATVSSGSSIVSPLTVTAMLLVVSPAAKVKVPAVSVSKSVPEVAVPVPASA